MSRETSELPLCLVIEDQTLVAISIRSYPQNAGMCVHTVASTAEARAWLVSNTADVAIIDIMLGDSAATELARELARCAIPFVIYSGHPRAEHTVRTRGRAVTGKAVKPGGIAQGCAEDPPGGIGTGAIPSRASLLNIPQGSECNCRCSPFVPWSPVFTNLRHLPLPPAVVEGAAPSTRGSLAAVTSCRPSNGTSARGERIVIASHLD